MKAILSAIERIIFLKQVTFFQGMTIDQLKVLASICEEELIPKSKTSLKKAHPRGVVHCGQWTSGH